MIIAHIFLLQMEELSLLKEKILCCCSMTQSEVSVSQFNALINSVVLARSTTELEEIAASIRNEQNCLVGI